MPTLLSRISHPSAVLVRALALAVLTTQVLISVTGSVVRVTGSGLGCPTWPRCFPESMVPVSHPEVSTLHQVIEFGNRTLTGLVGFVALACFLAAWRARPYRPRLVRLALIMPVGVVIQAIIGGITVLVGLHWWVVAIHFLASALLVWLATHLVKATAEGDQAPVSVLTPALRRLLPALIAVTAATLVAGTLVTAAGPHAGDAETPRLNGSVPLLAQVHALLVMAYVCLLAVFGVWLRHARPTKALLRAYGTACVLVLAQGALGGAQYLLGVPELMVVLHILGAMLVTIATALLWGESRYRGKLPHVSENPATNERIPA